MSTETKPVKRLRDAHAEATRSALVQAAAQRFAAVGFAETSLDDVAADAGTTKGAVYHHFKDKRALFEAVYERLSDQLVQAVARSEQGLADDPRRAIQAFLRHACEPAYQRVLFKDGPGVLGAALCRTIDLRYSLGLIVRQLHLHGRATLVEQAGDHTLARLVLALLIEAAQSIASSEAPQTASRQMSVGLEAMVLTLMR